MTTLVVFYYLSESEILPDKRREVIFGGSCLIRIELHMYCTLIYFPRYQFSWIKFFEMCRHLIYYS